MNILEDQALQDAIAGLPRWTLSEQGLRRELSFADFKQALAFVNRVGALAEAAGHHPDIDVRYNRVALTLITHDVGGITRRDIKMAKHLDRDLEIE
jgi:4a-hydroxytetrahydrobiopterin dehydratase